MDSIHGSAVEIEILRQEKARLVKDCVKLRSKLDDARIEISELKREMRRIRRAREHEIANAIKENMEKMLREISDG